jgi:hypothetical protein
MERVNPEKIIEILGRHNVHISLLQAQLMMNFMTKLVKSTISQISRK